MVFIGIKQTIFLERELIVFTKIKENIYIFLKT